MLQFIPVSTIVWLATVITVATGSYCATSNNPHFAHIWLTVIKTISTIVSVVACLRFYKKKKTQLAPHKVMLKFVAFKGIVGLNFLQTVRPPYSPLPPPPSLLCVLILFLQFIIGILVGNGTIAPSKYLSYDDIKTGLPSLLLACEMPIFAVLLFVAFPVSVYKNAGQGPAAGPLTALFQAFNITDLLSSFIRGPMRLLKEQQWGMQRQSSFPLQADPANAPLYQQTEYGVERSMGA